MDREGQEIDCLLPVAENEWVRGFLLLPGQAAPGRLRLVEDVPSLSSRDRLVEALPLVLQDSSMGTPACLVEGFVVHHGISLPLPPAFPLVVHVDEAIVGSNDPDALYPRACVRSQEMLDFFEVAQLKAEDVVKARTLVAQRESATFGDFNLTASEIATSQTEDKAMTLAWLGEIALEGEEKRLSDWSDSLVKALALFAFCIDRPLIPERIYTTAEQGEVDLHVRWQEPNAPTSTVPLLTESRLSVPFSDIASKWEHLWQRAEHLLNHVHAFQNRQNRLTLDDRVLVLARSLELYHAYAKRFQSTIRKKAEHKKLRNRILSALPVDLKSLKEWIEGALNEANRKRLATQIQDILEDLGDDVCAACGITEDPEEFASIVTASRNQFTHPKKKIPKKVPEGRDLVILAHRLWFLVRACVLLELGLPREKIVEALNRSSQRHYIVHG